MEDLNKPPLFFGRKIAAPSWVIPGSITENCQFLAGKVHDIELLFFETKSSLAYDEIDLPASLSLLPLSYHVHLPTDLKGDNGATDGKICCELVKKVQHLHVERAILHVPHDNACTYLESFMQCWIDAGLLPQNLLLENTKEQSLLSLQDAIIAMGASVCIDIGHAFAYEHTEVFQAKDLIKSTKMIHLNAPGKNEKKSHHLPLTFLHSSERNLCKPLLAEVPQEAVLTLELFEWGKIESSLSLLTELLETRESF